MHNIDSMASSAALDEGQRLSALVATGLRPASDPAFETFTRLVRRQLDVPVALVSLVDRARQFFPGAAGLPEPYASERQTPLTHSFCQHVVATGDPLVVDDARDEPLLCDNLAIPDLGVVGYAGMPLVDGQGHTLGSLCAIDTTVRQWTAAELETLRDLAAACSAELQLRIALVRADLARDDAEVARREAEEARTRAEEAGTRLDLLARVTRETTSTLDVDTALRRLADMLVPALGDWCVMDLRDGDLVRRVAVKHQRPDVTIERLGRRQIPYLAPGAAGPLTTVLQGTRPRQVVRLDELDRPAPGQDPLHDAQRQLWDVLGGHSALIFALPGRRDVVGAITLVRAAGRPFALGELTLLDEVARHAGLALDNATLFQSQRRAAETLQSSLLTTLPDTSGLQLSARYEPAGDGVDVGGDWYDAFPVGDDATAVAIGDVMGHDLAAAGRMGQLRNMLRTLASDRRAAPSELLCRLDRVAADLGVDALATCVLGVLCPTGATGGGWRLTWSNAGHLPPVLLASDGTSRLLDHGNDLMLGIDAATPRRDHVVDLAPGDTVIMVTDGLIETRDTSLDEGLRRLRRHAEQAAHHDLDDLCERLIATSAGNTNSDDVAAIAVRVPPGRSARR